MKYLAVIILIGAGIYLFYRIRDDDWMPDIPDEEEEKNA